MWDVLLTETGALDRLGEVWTELWRRTRPPPPMLELAWVREWWRLHAAEGELQILLVLDERRQPVGLAPLYRRCDRGGRRPYLRTILFLGTGEHEQDEVLGEYNAWLAAPEMQAVVSARVAAHLLDRAASGWDLLRLERLHPQARIHLDLEPLMRDQLSDSQTTSVAGFRSPTLPLEPYLAALPSGNFRHRCRRALRAGKEAGVEVVRAAQPAEFALMFEALRELHQRRWTALGHGGVFASGVFSRFHERYVERASRADSLWMVGLRQQQRWLAVRYLLQAGDHLYDYVSGVDTETETALAPGLLLHLHTIDAAAAAGIKVYDLGAGDQEYKRRLALEQVSLPTLELFARTVRARLWLTAREVRRDWKLVRSTTGAPQPAAAPPSAPA